MAAQSIGEPGTQLTMRTFHTGGIFTGKLIKQICAPYSGILYLPKNIKAILNRTNTGQQILKLKQLVHLILINWKYETFTLILPKDSYLYILNSQFIKKGTLIGQFSTTESNNGTICQLKPIYTNLNGEIHIEKKCVTLLESKLITQNLWLKFGSIFELSNTIKYYYLNFFSTYKAIGHYKLISPRSGIYIFKHNSILVVTNTNKMKMLVKNKSSEFKSYCIKFISLVKNYQYIDSHTILGYFYIFPKIYGSIFNIRKKNNFLLNLFEICIIQKNHIWNIFNDYIFCQKNLNSKFSYIGTSLNSSLLLTTTGLLFNQIGNKYKFIYALPLYLPIEAFRKSQHGDLINQPTLLATLVTYSPQTEDIVQGLPKIEKLIEIQQPKLKSILSSKPGISLNNTKEILNF